MRPGMITYTQVTELGKTDEKTMIRARELMFTHIENSARHMPLSTQQREQVKQGLSISINKL